MPPSAIRTIATATSTRRSQRRRGSGLDIAGNGNQRTIPPPPLAREDAPVHSLELTGGEPSREEIVAALRAHPAIAALLENTPALAGVHLVGGAVRDLLLGLQPKDLDLVVEGDAAAAATRLGERLISHDRFGTASFMLAGHTYDIATARTERYPQPGMLPVVEPAGIDADLRRRDFTLNAIAISLDAAELGRLRHVPHALEDLAHRRLRVLHERSFSDDPTRLLRLVRYAARLWLEVEQQTAGLLAAAIEQSVLASVSGARSGAELRLLATEPDPVATLAQLHRLGLDEALAPGFGLRDADRARHALKLLHETGGGRADLLALAAAGLEMDGGALAEMLDRLAFERTERELVHAAATQAPAVARALAAAQRPSQIAAAARDHAPETVALAAVLGGGEGQARRWLGELRAVELEIDGHDLRAAGVPEGPAIGRALRAALDARLDGEAPNRASQLERALRQAPSTG